MNSIRQFFHNRSRKQILLVSLLGTVVFGLAFLYIWVFADLPSINEIEAGLALPSTRIYDRNGKLLYEILPPEQGRNTAINLETIPQHCINATIATEDANFYEHPGIDVEGIVRALWINIQGGEIVAGGSTITQQATRLLLLDPQQQAQRTLQRKLKEMVLAIQMQSAYSKDHVLTLYLNQVYYGNLAYGIEAAAQTYFHKSASELSLSECSLLAGIVQNAVLHDPLSNFESAKQRQETTLRLMKEQGYITDEEAELALHDELQFGATPFPIKAPHFVMAVWKQLERQFPEQLYNGGLEVVTTVDLNWQETAQEIAQQQLANLNSPFTGNGVPANANNAAVVALDPFTGQVLTMLGSPDYFNESINGAVNASLALRQPGSALKPFTYAVAMNPESPEPYTAATMILDVETPFITRRLESYTPSNFGLVEHGPVLVREALASSFNIPAVITLEHVGLNNFVQFLSNTGIHNLTDNTDVDLSITLGGGEVRLLDLAQSYSMFPNGGFDIEPVFILKVSDHDDNILHEWQPEPLNRRVLDERIAFIITDILSDSNARIPSFGLVSPLDIGRPVAAKTGTTTDFRDNWVIGYTPNLVVGVWVGNANNTPMVDVTGVSGAGPIWNLFMRRILLGQPQVDFEKPEELIQRQVCSTSGLLPTDACPQTRIEWFIPGTEPTEPDYLHQTFIIDRNTGQIADENTRDEDRVEQVYLVLPPEARNWAIRNGIPQPPQGAPVQLADTTQVRLLEPDPYTIFELSPITPQATQRVRLTVGAPENTQSVTYFLNDEPIGTVDHTPWDFWWALELGQHSLTAVATFTDGTAIESSPIPFQVVEYSPIPPAAIQTP